MKKDRDIQDLDSYLGNFSKLISQRIKGKEKIKILDAGCGYGLVMAGLIAKFDNKIELIGYNKLKKDGTLKDFVEKTLKRKILSKEKVTKLKPKIVYFYIDKGLLFKDNSFDLIFSLASVYLYKDKIKFFEECNRILKQSGIARIHLFELKKENAKMDDMKKINLTHYQILDNEREIRFIDYLENIKGIRLKLGKRNDNKHTIVYLEIKKQPKLDFGLRFVKSIKSEDGIQSIYEVRK